MDHSQRPPVRDPSSHGDVTAAAPDALEVVRSFMSMHDHEPGISADRPPSVATIERWLRDRSLIGDDEPAVPAELEWALQVQEALRSRVRAYAGGPPDPTAERVLDRAAVEARLRVRFGAREPIQPEAGGVRGAIGRLVGGAFLAELDGSFRRLRECHDPECTTIFFDRSKNHTGKWCSMAGCGNRNKVRRFRERERAANARARPNAGARRS
jgi:predicted RNA-binding Zn ribbon-like protein